MLICDNVFEITKVFSYEYLRIGHFKSDWDFKMAKHFFLEESLIITYCKNIISKIIYKFTLFIPLPRSL